MGYLFNERGNVLAHGIDNIGAHGVSYINEEMDDKHSVIQNPYLEVLCTAPEVDEDEVLLVGQ